MENVLINDRVIYTRGETEQIYYYRGQESNAISIISLEPKGGTSKVRTEYLKPYENKNNTGDSHK